MGIQDLPKFDQLSSETVAALGLGVFVMVIVEVLKQVGAIKDGEAGTVATYVNVVIFALVAIAVQVFGVNFESAKVESVLDIFRIASDLLMAVLGTLGSHKAARAMNVKGFRKKS